MLNQILDFLKKEKQLAAFILGGMMVFAMPPINFFPLVFICFSGLMWLIQHAENKKKAFFTGGFFGFGYFIFGFYWLGIIFQARYPSIAWLFPVISVLGPLLISVFYALAAVAVYPFRHRPVLYALLFPSVFFWAEVLRIGTVQFPWNIIGSTWYDILPVLQVLSLIGIYGLTFLTIFWALLPFCFFQKNKSLYGPGLIAAISFMFCFAYGSYRLNQNPTAYHPDIQVQILQPNITAKENRRTYKKEDIFQRKLALMQKHIPQKDIPLLSFWPEGSFYVSAHNMDPDYYRRMGEALPENSYAAFGMYQADLSEKGQTIKNLFAISNTAGEVLTTHQKHRLVPWGEYIPLESVFKHTGLYRYMAHIPRIENGAGPEVVKVPGFPSLTPVMCYEAAFSSGIVDKKNRPELLAFVSNDAWSAGSVNPKQNFSFTRLRAIEEGLPAVRAANIGISAVFDAYGRELQRLTLHETGVINSAIPKPAIMTFFARYGTLPVFILAGIWLISFLLYGGWKRQAGFKSGA